jgi:hypothetical protein
MTSHTFRNRLGELVEIPEVAATQAKNTFGELGRPVLPTASLPESESQRRASTAGLASELAGARRR